MVDLNEFNAVVFDCDGVIADTEPLHYEARRRLLTPLGVTLTPTLYASQMMARHYTEALRNVCTPEQLPESEYERMYERIQAMYNRLRVHNLRAIGGIHQLVMRVARRGMPMAVASTQPHDTVASVVEHVLGRDARYLRTIVSGQDVSRNKPHPDVYMAAATKLGVDPKRCVAIEDSVSGVQAAVAAGMCCVARVSEWTGRKALLEAGAREVVFGYDRLFT